VEEGVGRIGGRLIVGKSIKPLLVLEGSVMDEVELVSGSAGTEDETRVLEAVLETLGGSVALEASDSLVLEASALLVLEAVLEASTSLVLEALDSLVLEASDSLVLEALDSLVLEASDSLVLEALDSLVLEASDSLVLEALDSLVLEVLDSLVLEASDSLVLEALEALEVSSLLDVVEVVEAGGGNRLLIKLPMGSGMLDLLVEELSAELLASELVVDSSVSDDLELDLVLEVELTMPVGPTTMGSSDDDSSGSSTGNVLDALDEEEEDLVGSTVVMGLLPVPTGPADVSSSSLLLVVTKMGVVTLSSSLLELSSRLVSGLRMLERKSPREGFLVEVTNSRPLLEVVEVDEATGSSSDSVAVEFSICRLI
jgi:hypothetical protein